ncbi:major facilitator superfamily domain-containing protein [Microdochium bolleyi]|uniref:Major facilitator superfamily domain-containing protein n=1 Tax=Microdochium bolleyi TaxID=196109 RepID=A0A136IS68_9PEZI|nr:major facilitator superfamily domain-containing protein [Microdochium bolleyi]
MGLGILEAHTTGLVPGTVPLDDGITGSAVAGVALKKGTGRFEDIILAPQPSDDPNDPLNWTWWEKHVTLAIVSFGTIIVCVTPGPMLNAAVLTMAIELERPITDITKRTGYFLLAGGAMGPLVSALARKYGKRPQFLFGSFLGVVSVIIGQTASQAGSAYSTLVASRVIGGVAATAYESLALSLIGDLFFVHERGPRVGLLIFSLSAVSNGVSIIAGPIAANLGWIFNFHILLPFMVLQFLLTIFFVPETTYRRQTAIDTALITLAKSKEKAEHVENDAPVIEPGQADRGGPAIARKSFVQRMSIFNGVFVEDSIIKMILGCIVSLSNLGVLYSIIGSGVIISWFVGVSLIASLLFASPAYGYTAAGVGYTSTGPLIGGTLGTLLVGAVSDPTIRWMARRNGGIYEPEFRLPITALGCVATVAGLVGVGNTIEEGQSIYLVCFLWGLMLFGMTIVASASTAYILDAFQDLSVEAFVMNMVFKNFFYYGVTEFVVPWWLAQGSGNMYSTQAGITAGLCLLAVPLYVFGKKYRHFWATHNVIQMLHLETDRTGTE